MPTGDQSDVDWAHEVHPDDADESSKLLGSSTAQKLSSEGGKENDKLAATNGAWGSISQLLVVLS